MLMMTLEELDGAFVLFRRFARREGAKIAPLASLRIGLARIESVFTRGKFPDRVEISFELIMARVRSYLDHVPNYRGPSLLATIKAFFTTFAAVISGRCGTKIWPRDEHVGIQGSEAPG